jgi:hypothetical protein
VSWGLHCVLPSHMLAVREPATSPIPTWTGLATRGEARRPMRMPHELEILPHLTRRPVPMRKHHPKSESEEIQPHANF